jgi:hypothetical protein
VVGRRPRGGHILGELTEITLTPAEHQRVKDLVNGDHLDEVRGHERRYLVAGAGGETDATSRRRHV